ncbi:tRNA (adenosine(37)-N6)-threonylcarbamoyltransferase complex dimerization subunit type 1 TsaB [Patescibacteria group bacterium]|nr:tRNA (adenosine(37)-N6)-threonylcarbamoyltransferase complex dimerization subunit type 1 TsaB [Patescibacteria group bacterium]MBU4511913.1 tRNA (adenosine(37)-N6)-threonylcarbamoyltransferase complex dimerization subunit type 1 TsaB [Patescibacteria group bacterium]MCG2692881.1 tRNA (adenosine(37)-N6)-threonylcarbamoyltransferase complex dimerization subunit type 1 TsaB [Candidatus Parcubacteria bacterium]
MILVINTAESNKLVIAITRDDFILDKTVVRVQYKESEKLLSTVDKLLKKNKVKLTDLQGVVVVKGPGGFSSVRVGVVVANTLSYALQIPVVGVKLSEFEDLQGLIKMGKLRLKKTRVGETVEPFYGREPNITGSKWLTK